MPLAVESLTVIKNSSHERDGCWALICLTKRHAYKLTRRRDGAVVGAAIGRIGSLTRERDKVSDFRAALSYV